ncbi:MAG: hypothetical protein RIC55_32620 [Pirellulaceae bacterium]
MMTSDVLNIGSRVTVLPVIHGSGDFSLEVRRVLLSQTFDCLAAPLPASFQQDVERAIERLPVASMVLQRERPRYRTLWTPESDDDFDDEDAATAVSYVPIDPCQPVIAALRIAMGEHLRREFIDLETRRYEPITAVLPDPYALKQVSLERFSAAVLPALPRPQGQAHTRIQYMAARLRELSQQCESILLVCSVVEWPWIRQAYLENQPCDAANESVEPVEHYPVDPQTLLFLFGELPFITGLYERARKELEDDENLSIDGVKELLLAARDAYRADFKGRARNITPHLLRLCLKYLRNLSLVERRMTPDLYSIVTAAKQIAGDQYALHAAETARSYPYAAQTPSPVVTMGIDQARLPDGELVETVSRLPGHPITWRSLQLKRRPDRRELEKWRMRWNPFTQCSWPPEDELVENFRAHVFDRARAIMGADLARTEKFTTSIMDGIDIRDTLRHWYEGDLYVKVLPPSQGQLDAAVMLFDSPADPRDYPWRTTWFAEHEEESTLAFFATDFRREMVGPGIGLANYGGALFLYPPISIRDVWQDRRLDFTETMEERLVAAACLHSRERQIALLSALPPGAGWRRLARRFRKTLVHVPLPQFSESTIQQLRMVHVLNGREVRSYAARFIRRA